MINILEAIEFSGGVVSLMFSLALFIGPTKNLYNRLLGGTFCCLGIFLIINGLPLFYSGPISLSYFRITFLISILSVHLSVPMLYLCSKAIVDEDFLLSKKLILFFLPTFIFAASLLFDRNMPEMEGSAYFLENYIFSNHQIYLLVPIVSVSSSVLFFIDIIASCRRQKKKNAMRNKTITAMIVVSGILMAIMLSWGISFILKSPAQVKSFVYSFISIYIVGIYIFSGRYNLLFHPGFYQEEEKKKYKMSKLENVNIARSLTFLKEVMEQEKPYIDPDLTIRSLASMIDLSPQQLSELINQKLGYSFILYVNNYRIDEARKLLLQEDEIPILTVALQSGFNTISAFYRVFKKVTGQSPGEFRKNQRDKKSHPDTDL